MTIPLDTSDDLPVTRLDDQAQDTTGSDGAMAGPNADLSPLDGAGEGGALMHPFGEGPSMSEADLEEVDLMAEHALAHIGLAALTSGDPAPARAMLGLTADPSPEDGEDESGEETAAPPEDTEPSEETESSATSSASSGDPDPALPADS